MHINGLSREQLAGQRLMVGFRGTGLNHELEYLINELKVGGIILFARNLESPDQIRELCGSAQAYAEKCGQPPLFIAIDQEGGTVARLKPPFTQFPGNSAMKDESDAVRFAQITARELTDIGFNMNMAPVLDVLPASGKSVMEARSFGRDPHWVSRLGLAVIRHFQEHRIMAVAKHFPGIGRTVLDSHEDMPTMSAGVDDLEKSDLIPFRAAIAQNVAGVMISHIRYDQIDDQWPASLSERVVKDLLREILGYNGVVLTDDLDMGAIQNHYDIQVIIEQVLTADIDIPIICHSLDQMTSAFGIILQNLEQSSENLESGMKSVERILKLKQEYLAV